MAEDATATESETDQVPPLTIIDGSPGTIVLEEDAEGASASSPNAGASGNADNPGLTVVIAERDPETGEITLVEGKSTEGDGRVQISGTDRVFEDQAAFEEFLAEVNAKADAGVPFEDIIGNDVNAIPVLENGAATGETLGGIEVGPAPGEVVQLPGQPTEEAEADPEGATGTETPSTNGSGGIGPIGDQDHTGTNDAVDRLRGIDDDAPPTGPAADDRQPGRDENGNLLPGAEGQVTLDDFNRINDLDGNGINDGVENPVDLGGATEGEAPRADEPVVPGRDETPQPPAHQPEPPGASEDPFLPGDGAGVIREPVAPANVEPGSPPVHVAPPVVPPNIVAEVAPVAPPPAEAPVAPAFEGYPDDEAPAVTEAAPVAAAHIAPPVAPAVDAYPVAATGAVAHAAAALDTFDTGTAPSAPPEVEPLPNVDVPVAAVNLHEPQATAVHGQPAAAEDCPPDEEGAPGLVAAVASAAALAPAGAALGATDVFDRGAIAGAAVAGGTTDDGGNLLERIFEKVKDVLFDSGEPDPSPVQLPVQADPGVSDLPVAAALNVTEPFLPDGFDNSPPLEDTGDDAL